MRKLLAHLFPLTLGAISGLLVMNVATPAFAQGTKIHADAALVCAWDQPAAALTAAQAITFRATLDSASPVSVVATCSGAASPFTCQFPLSPAFQTTGPHTLRVEGANVDPIDGSLSPFTQTVSVAYEIVPPLVPPAPGANGRIIKFIGGLIAAVVGIWFSFAHHG